MSAVDETINNFISVAERFNGVKEGSSQHNIILNIYNSSKPAGEYTMTANDPWCAAFVGAIAGGCGLGNIIPVSASCDRMISRFPSMGGKRVGTPQRGDISVVPSNCKHPFGHIAVYNGKQWVSDFKQNHILPSKAYRANGTYQIYRATDGWHWKHVWTTPVDWYGWVEAVVKGRKHIKF